jgi:hypothetical protein
MKTQHPRQVSLLRRTVACSALIIFCFIGATAYSVLGGTEMFQARSYKASQLSADARTVAAAITYLLEVEPPDLDTNAAASLIVG